MGKNKTICLNRWIVNPARVELTLTAPVSDSLLACLLHNLASLAHGNLTLAAPKAVNMEIAEKALKLELQKGDVENCGILGSEEGARRVDSFRQELVGDSV